MKKTYFMAAACGLLMAFGATSCEKSAYPGYKMTESGLYYKYLVENDGPTAQLGEVVEVDLAYYLNDSLMYSTKDAPEPVYDLVHEPSFAGDLYEGFTMMHKGDSMSMIMPADSVFLKMFNSRIVPDFVDSASIIRWEVKLVDIMTEEEVNARIQAAMDEKFAAADETLRAYLAENNIEATPTESGLIYVCTQPGNGAKPEAGKKVKVHYTGTLLDGTKFDSSVDRGEPFEFPLGMGYVIPGWDEGVAMMSKGEKGILYVPAKLAYGERQAGPIPAFSNLIFEVELVDFE